MFKTRNQLNEQIAALELQVADHDDAIESAILRASEAEARLQEAADAVVAANQIAAAHEATITAITAERDDLAGDKATLEAENESLTEEAEITAEKISVEASRMLASQGVPPVNLEADGSVPTDLWAQMAKITDPAERRKFWKANEAALKRTLKG